MPNVMMPLSQIETRWSLVARAHRDEGDAANRARCELMVRYAGAVHRYLLRVARDPEVAADLTQEFALKFLRGDFRHSDPGRGRFRDYVKAAVHNLLADFRRRQKNQPRPLPAGGEWVDAPSGTPGGLDAEFLDCWRDEILNRAWDRLARHQDRTGRPFFTVLHFRAEHPALRSHEMAGRLADVLGKRVTAGWVRQNLLRARERFAEFARDEVSLSLGNPTDEALDEEMIDLGLWPYCRTGRVSRGATADRPR